MQRTEFVQTQDQKRLVDLESEDLRLNEGEGLAVDLDKALAGLAVRDRGGRLLLAEALYRLRWCRHAERLCAGVGFVAIELGRVSRVCSLFNPRMCSLTKISVRLQVLANALSDFRFAVGPLPRLRA